MYATLVLLSALAIPGQVAASPEAVVLTGKIREVGAGPGGRARPLLVLDDGSEVDLHAGGDREAAKELLRLSGVRVRIEGSKGDERFPGGIRVDRYEILDVGGGVKPRIGTLASLELEERPRLLFVDEEGRAELLPEGWARKMKTHVGAKVWIVGSASKGRLTPTRFSILRSKRLHDE